MKNLKPARRILPIIFFIFLFCINIFSQVEIKERVEINPGTGTMNPLISGCTFGNCSYYDCDSSEIYIRFTPASVEPGETAIMKLWIVDSVYEYNEENYDIIQKTITIEPECGQLTYLGGGEYLFTAPDTLTVDSFVVTINYENYNQFCAGWDAKGERMIVKDNFDCIDCPIPLLSILWRDYASGQLTIKWDSLNVRIEPSEIAVGDTAQVIIKKRLPDGTLVDFDSMQTYEIAKLEGCVLGEILVGSETGAYFYDVSQPIYFAAADSLVGDTIGTVLLQVGLVINDKKLGLEDKPNAVLSNECFTGNFISSSRKDKSFQVGPTIELLSYTNGEDTVKINGTPAMPEFPIELEITNDSEGGILIYTLFVKWVNNEQTGHPEYVGAAKDVVIINPEDLPIINFNVYWHWYGENIIVGGDELILNVEYKGIVKNFNLNTDILGDNPDLKATYRTYVSTQLPDPKDDHMNVVLYYESRFHQFENNYVKMNLDDPDTPDWGVSQIHKTTPTIGEIWNWKENINSGIYIFNEKYTEAINYPSKCRGNQRIKSWYKIKYTNIPDFTTDEQKFKETHHLYLGGHYWRWFPEDRRDPNSLGEWKPYPQRGHNRGGDAWELYQQIKVGNFPPEWN